MKDIFKKYSQHKLVSNAGIVLASLVLAISVNLFLIDGTNIGQNLKASVLNFKNESIQSDIYLEKKSEAIALISNKEMSHLQNLSLSLTYNPEILTIGDVSSDFGTISVIGADAGIYSLILTLESPKNIHFGEEILNISTTKKGNEAVAINSINANFSDGTDTYHLSTSGINF